ncbi:MAG: AAA family ATPase [Planctomycetota bacterium]|nr:AAA family ATPase [Planctomycetota bacterium]
MNALPPIIVVLGGPNGAGKTTASERLLGDHLNIAEYVNADVIARGLSGFDPERSAIPAARIMLERIETLANERANFAFETTLASRSFAPWLRARTDSGYELHLFYIWLSSAEAAIARVASRVRSGGHDIPEDTIRRRYPRGIRNLFDLYMPIATRWTILNGAGALPTSISSGGLGSPIEVLDSSAWAELSSRRDDP